jgi:hypothetical protein
VDRIERARRDYERRKAMTQGAERLRALGRQVPRLRVDRVDGVTVALDYGTPALVIPEHRRDAMVRWTRALGGDTASLLADLLETAASTPHVPSPVVDLLLRLAAASDVDAELEPPKRGLEWRQV